MTQPTLNAAIQTLNAGQGLLTQLGETRTQLLEMVASLGGKVEEGPDGDLLVSLSHGTDPQAVVDVVKTFNGSGMHHTFNHTTPSPRELTPFRGEVCFVSPVLAFKLNSLKITCAEGHILKVLPLAAGGSIQDLKCIVTHPNLNVESEPFPAAILPHKIQKRVRIVAAYGVRK